MQKSEIIQTTGTLESPFMNAQTQTALPQLSFSEVVNKYPEVPRLVILKTDVQRRGVTYTDAALDSLDDQKHQVIGTHIFGARDGKIARRPESLLLRDGTSIITTPTPLEQNPYTVDRVGEKLFLTDKGQVLEEVEYWPRPDFYAKTASSGTLMKYIVSARPKRLSIFPYRYCQFWNEGQGCLFCDIVPQLKRGKEDGIPARIAPEEVAEVIDEALKEPGRFTGICLTGGSVMSGPELFYNEVDYYIQILNAIGKNLQGNRFTSQLIATAFSQKQLRRLHDETGLNSYTADLEVLNERLFGWICPGKARWVGYAEWKRRLVQAVEIFGRGNVDTGIVAGVELAKPHGFLEEDEALDATLSEAEDLARQGVSTVFMVWSPRPNSALGGQSNASLEYYVRLAKGLHQLRLKYKLPVEFDDFRNCGNHPDTDLSRITPQVDSRGQDCQLTPALKAALQSPSPTKALATSDEFGVPHLEPAPWVSIDDDGSLVYLDPLQGSTTNRNLTHSLWFERSLALTVSGLEGELWHITGIPIKAHVCGPTFRKHYEQLRQDHGDTDLAAVWIIQPQSITVENSKAKQARHDALHPTFRHLDRIKTKQK